MSRVVNSVEDVIDALGQRGFGFVGKTNNNWFRLTGRLAPPSADKSYLCEVLLDPTFLEFPGIRLLELPDGLPPAAPHIGPDGELCYLSKGSVVLDIYDPVGQSLACLEQAATVLGQVIRGEMVEDLTEEFFAYWRGLYCFVDLQGEELGRQKCIVAEASGSPFWFITDDEDRTGKKLKSIGCEVTERSVLTYRVRTDAQPRPMTSHWPPETVADILAWQGTLDPRCRKKIYQRVREGEREKVKGALILIESPLLTYGFAVRYEHRSTAQKGKRSDRRESSYGLKVAPTSVIRIDDRFLAQRNMPNSRTLAGKNLAVVGCGTIGGYLSEMLAKAGAGTCGGKLTLVDFDFLLPQNIGRHRLGFPDLLSNKAEAMAEELKRLAPGTGIRALPVDVRTAHLGAQDLLIDATGEESLGHWLCGHYRASTPMLSVWIEGPGTAVRGLLNVGSAGACYRCLWQSSKRGELRSTIDPLPSIMAGHGCEGLYVPFPASVSVQAASLGTEMVLDWVNGVCAPALRTRLIDRNHRLATADCDPPPDRECPICNS